jgi:hypothetical protein
MGYQVAHCATDMIGSMVEIKKYHSFLKRSIFAD